MRAATVIVMMLWAICWCVSHLGKVWCSWVEFLKALSIGFIFCTVVKFPLTSMGSGLDQQWAILKIPPHAFSWDKGNPFSFRTECGCDFCFFAELGQVFWCWKLWLQYHTRRMTVFSPTWWIFWLPFSHLCSFPDCSDTALFCPILSCFKGTYFILLHPSWQCQLFWRGYCLSNCRSFHTVQVLKSPQTVKLYIREILVTLLMPVTLKIKAFPHSSCDLIDLLACKISTFQSLKPSYILVTWFSPNQQTALCRCECFNGTWLCLG